MEAMLAYETRARVAIVRPTTVPGPDDWFASLDPILDDDGAWCLLVDGTAIAEVDEGWDDDAALRGMAWRKPAVLAFDGEWGGRFRDFHDVFDILVTSPAAGRTDDGEFDLRQQGIAFAIADDPFAEALRIATVVASRAPHATQLAKEAIWRGMTMPLEQALRFETDLTLLLQTTKDRAEGVTAFLEKRQPNFIGS
jgi:hypothetical protein